MLKIYYRIRQKNPLRKNFAKKDKAFSEVSLTENRWYEDAPGIRGYLASNGISHKAPSPFNEIFS